jgi:hypothetical protein
MACCLICAIIWAGLLVLAIAGLVIYFVYIRPSRRKAAPRFPEGGETWADDQTGGWDEAKPGASSKPQGEGSDRKPTSPSGG